MFNLQAKILLLIPLCFSLFFTIPKAIGQLTATGVWQTVTPASGAPVKRHECSYVKAGSKFYLLGGRGIKPVQAYDPVNKSWVNKVNTPIELHHFQAITFNGLIYVVGAFTGTYPHETPVTRFYIYNPATNTWQNGAVIPSARRRGSAGVVVYNNKIYMVCGIKDGHWAGWVSWFDEFDPATNTWKTLPDAPRSRDHFQAVVINNKLYLAGGRRSSASTGQTFSLTVSSVDVYDFITGKWSSLPSANIPTPRAGTAAAVLGNELLIIGGESAQPTAHSQTESLNVQTNVWRRLGDLNQPRHGTQVIEDNNALYIVAGSGNQGGSPELNSQEVFKMSSSPSNQPPVVNAGSDKTITLPTNSVTLTGSANDPDGTIAGYTWTKSSGPSMGTISSPASASTNVTGLEQGTYIFRLTVKDNNAPAPATAYDEVKVTVNPAFTGQLVSFTLVNSTDDKDIRTLVNGTIINLATVAGRNLNIRGNTNITVGSVSLKLSGAQTKTVVENTMPYALFGDDNGNYNNWPATVGNYTLTGMPYSAKQGAGTPGKSLTVNFSITDQATTSSAVKKITEPEKTPINALTAKVFSNDGGQHFNLKIFSRSNQPVSIKIFDAEGKLIESRHNINVNEALSIGISYRPGLYYAEVRQGTEKYILKILKQ